jgi:hypothetical protein
MLTRSGPPAPSVRDGLVRQSVVVTLVDETGVRGVLWASDDTGLMLAPAAGSPVQTWSPGGDWVDADGSMFVPLPAVKFVQVLGSS